MAVDSSLHACIVSGYTNKLGSMHEGHGWGATRVPTTPLRVRKLRAYVNRYSWQLTVLCMHTYFVSGSTNKQYALSATAWCDMM
jgi:hypothetical protein